VVPFEALSLAKWSEAFCTTTMSLEIIISEKGNIRRTTLTKARGIYGPALLGGTSLAVAWVETDWTTWRLCVFTNNSTYVLTESLRPLRNPAIVQDEVGQLWVGCDFCKNGIDVIHIFSANGSSGWLEVKGRHPTLVSTKGYVWLTGERRGKSRTEIVLMRLTLSGKTEQLTFSQLHPWNFLPHLFATKDGLFLAWESTPGFAPDDRQAFFREIQLRQIDAHTARVHNLFGTLNGIAPIDMEAFEDGSVFNRIPIHPKLFGNKEQIWLAYRSFRFFGHKCFGWDLLAIPLRKACKPKPRVLTSAVGFPDTRYGVCLTDDKHILVAAHIMTHKPQRWLNELKRARTTQPARNHCVEIRDWDIVEKLPHQRVQSYVPVFPHIPPRLVKHCPEPIQLSHSAGGLRLIWGDMHAHSCYSKCMPANDGTPEDVLRFQRDVLGCQILTLTDHIEYMSAVEFRHVTNVLAAEASNGVIVLYGVEWAKYPAHHVNFFAYNRDIFEKLREILLSESHLQKVFARVKTELPSQSVMAIRHFHGMLGEPYGVNGRKVTETYDSNLEWAMEVVQTRGDMMVQPPPSYPYFPANFIQAGAKIGLVGGSDHSRGGPLKFCLTGFWVKELTPQAVFAAIRRQRTIASASGKLAIWITLTHKTLQIEVSSPTPLIGAALWHNGKWIERVDLSTKGIKTDFSIAIPEYKGNKKNLVVRIEACPIRPCWPTLVGYAQPVVEHYG